MPVVSAAILAAMLVPAYARRRAKDKNFTLESMESQEASAPMDTTVATANGHAASSAKGKGKAKAKGARGAQPSHRQGDAEEVS